jgi:hypothetical protein
MFLFSPSPSEIDVVKRVGTYLLDSTERESTDETHEGQISVRDSLSALIGSMAHASRPVVRVPYERKGFVDWSWRDAKKLWSKTIEWWHGDWRNVATARNAATFLWRAVLPKMDTASEADWKDVIVFLEEARQRGVFLTKAWPYVLIHRSSETQRVGRMIADDLSSDVKGAVEAGAHAVRHWIHLADAGVAERPPKQAVDALLHRVVFRRRIGAEECLRQLTLLLAEQPGFFGLCNVDLMVASLTPWSESIRLPVQDDQDGDFPENERPDLRVQLGGLAAALSGWIRIKFPGRPEPRSIADLRAQYASDPLPEVRRSFDARS